MSPPRDKKHDMKNMMRLAALLLAVLMCAGAVACGKGEDVAATTAQNTEATTASTDAAATEEEPSVKLDLPETLNYNGDEVSVLHWDSEKPEFGMEEITGSLVNDAIYQRNTNIEERLGVKLKFTEQNGSVDYMAEFAQAVQNAFQSGAREYDIIPTYSRTAAILSTRGLYYNLNDIDDNYINLDQPWWPDCITSTVTIGDAIYFITGDCSTNVLHMMYTIWINKDLINEYKLEDPYTLVRNKQWTLDKLIELTTNTYQDLNNNGQEDDNDFFGFVGVDYGMDAFYTGSGLRLVDLHDTDYLIISPDYSSEKTVDLVDKLGAVCLSTDWSITSANTTIFQQERALFCQNRTYYAKRYLLEVDFSYGLVPTPMYDLEQENYISVLANPITLYGIMADAEVSRLSELTAVLECWGSEAYRLTTPALFETNMKLKYSETSDESEMFDIVRDTIFLDLGRVFSQDLQYMSEIPSSTAAEGGSWATKYAQYQRPLEKGIQKVVSTIRSFQG